MYQFEVDRPFEVDHSQGRFAGGCAQSAVDPVDESGPPAKRHLPNLDLLRGGAILLVFLGHLVYPIWGCDQVPWGRLFRQYDAVPRGFLCFYPVTFAWMAVSMFFVLSGFSIHYSIITSNRRFSAAGFYQRRFMRIYPPYLIALMLFAGLRVYAVTPLSVVTHLLLIQNFSGQSFFLINPSLWSIATEMQFYLVYPLLLMARNRVGMAKVLRWTLIFSLLARAGTACIWFHHHGIFDSTHRMLWWSPLITIFDWCLGAYAAECFAQGKRAFHLSRRWIALIVCLLLISTQVRPLSIFSFQIGSVICALVIERAAWSTRPISALIRPLGSLGLCSYSFYLLHQPLLELIIRFSRNSLLQNRFGLTLLIGPAAFLILWGISQWGRVWLEGIGRSKSFRLQKTARLTR